MNKLIVLLFLIVIVCNIFGCKENIGDNGTITKNQITNRK
jgi:hypothetical protein